jgi:hypothetical protein
MIQEMSKSEEIQLEIRRNWPAFVVIVTAVVYFLVRFAAWAWVGFVVKR